MVTVPAPLEGVGVLVRVWDSCVGKGEGGNVLVLNNFVAGLSGTSALDEGVAATEDGNGVFADVAEPDVC